MSGYGAGYTNWCSADAYGWCKKIVPIVTILTFYINFWRIILYIGIIILIEKNLYTFQFLSCQVYI